MFVRGCSDKSLTVESKRSAHSVAAQATRKFVGRRALSAAVFALAVSASSGALAQNCGPLLSGLVPGFDMKNVYGAGIAGGNAVAATINATNSAFLTHSAAFVSAPGNPAPDSQGGGVWARVIGGESTTKSSGTTSYNAAFPVPPPNTDNGTTNCNSTFKQNFAGVQVGTDVARLNVGGWNLHLGTTAGYMETRGSLSEGATPTAGSFDSTTQAPFIGTYAAATYGGFFAEGLVRFNYYETNLNSPSVNVYNQKLDAHGISVGGSLGYHYAVPNSNWFVEPSAGLIYSRVSVDPLKLSGAPNAPAATGFQGTTQIDDITSTLGRAGLRVGTTVDAGNMILQPFAAASIWHDFQGSWSGTYSSCTNCIFFGGVPGQLTASMSGSSVGTYGVYSLGLAGQIKDTGWLGYVRVDRTAGANLEGWTGSGGIRYQFTPGALPTAMITKAPAVASRPVNWTGFYIGGFGGAGYGRSDPTFAAAPGDGVNTVPFAGATADERVAGFLGGGLVGYNYQMGKWVWGVEADAAWPNIRGSRACGSTTPAIGDPTNALFNVTCHDQLDWLATTTVRLGYTWDRVLYYAKAGGAWTHENFSATCNQSPANNAVLVGFGQSCYNPAGALMNQMTASANRFGWTAGFGTEFALTDRWSAKGEFDYLDFGSRNLVASDGTVLSTKLSLWVTKIGLNYRFASQ